MLWVLLGVSALALLFSWSAYVSANAARETANALYRRLDEEFSWTDRDGFDLENPPAELLAPKPKQTHGSSSPP